jgi:hypothetical protein
MLYDYVKANDIKTPIKLELMLNKVTPDPMRNGNDKRYFTVKINGLTVTQMVAEAVNLKLSKAKDTYGCVIVKGTGSDMGWWLQERVWRAASDAGYPDMFDKADYVLLASA